MGNGILIGANSNIPANGSVLNCTSLFTCYEPKLGRNIEMFTGSKISGVYIVSYTVEPDVPTGVNRRWLYYSNSEYIISIGGSAEVGEYYSESSEYHTNYYYGTCGSILGAVQNLVFNDQIYNYPSLEEALVGEGIIPYDVYPITYHYTNSTVSGPSEAAVGDTVIVSAVPDVDYGITDASTQILVTNSDVAVPYTWDAVNQRITFTMPQPVENRGGFGSTGQ